MQILSFQNCGRLSGHWNRTWFILFLPVSMLEMTLQAHDITTFLVLAANRHLIIGRVQRNRIPRVRDNVIAEIIGLKDEKPVSHYRVHFG